MAQEVLPCRLDLNRYSFGRILSPPLPAIWIATGYIRAHNPAVPPHVLITHTLSLIPAAVFCLQTPFCTIRIPWGKSNPCCVSLMHITLQRSRVHMTSVLRIVFSIFSLIANPKSLLIDDLIHERRDEPRTAKSEEVEPNNSRQSLPSHSRNKS